jgi:hypothetical protein
MISLVKPKRKKMIARISTSYRDNKYCLEICGIIFAREGDPIVDLTWFTNRPGYFFEEPVWDVDLLAEAKEKINEEIENTLLGGIK